MAASRLMPPNDLACPIGKGMKDAMPLRSASAVLSWVWLGVEAFLASATQVRRIPKSGVADGRVFMNQFAQ